MITLIVVWPDKSQCLIPHSHIILTNLSRQPILGPADSSWPAHEKPEWHEE